MTTALIVGASRGLGLALVEEYLDRGWDVVGTVRGDARTKLHDLQAAHPGLQIERVDITVPETVAALRSRLADRRLDLLFVNAGVNNDPRETIGEVTTEEYVRVQITNALSPMRVVETFADLVTPDGTIGVMTSGLGSVANNQSGGYEVYRASKAALNTLMRSYAARTATSKRTLLLLAPGWVRTDMGGPDAGLEISDSIPSLVRVMEAQRGTPGLQYLDYRGNTVPW